MTHDTAVFYATMAASEWLDEEWLDEHRDDPNYGTVLEALRLLAEERAAVIEAQIAGHG